MSTAPRVSRERLNQIAGRKLTALKIPTRLAPDGVTLCGQMAFTGKVQDPVSGQPLTHGVFTVSGHDHLMFQTSPLVALGAVPFYDCEHPAALELRIVQVLAQRIQRVQVQVARVSRLGLQLDLEPERLIARGVVKTQTHAFELGATPHNVAVFRVAPLSGKPFQLPPDSFALPVEEFETPSDLEIFLVHLVPRMEEAAKQVTAAPAPSAVPHGPSLVATAAPAGVLTLSALQKLGADMAVTSTGLELVQDFALDGMRYRFVATHVSGTTFKAQLLSTSGERWSDKIDLVRFPGALQLVSTVLGLQTKEKPATGQTPSTEVVPSALTGLAPHAIAAAGSSHLAPVVGEVWVMNVLVEQEDPQEIRYVCTDVDGKPYGASRVLKRQDFEAVFALEREAWRLLIVIEEVRGEEIIYRQLDGTRQPRGTQKTLKFPLLLTTFLPEAAAY